MADIEKKSVQKHGCLKRFSNVIVGGLESGFYRFGVLIGNHPWKTILICIICVGLCGIGMLEFYQESKTENLWVPLGSPSVGHKEWVEKYYPSKNRFENILVMDQNVLQPKVLKGMLDMDNEIKALNSSTYNWTSICYKIFFGKCWSSSLLELWEFNETKIASLTEDDILEMVNTVSKSPVYFSDYDVSKVLGDITRNTSGYITGAKATTMTYFIIDNGDQNNKDEVALAWEQEFLNICEKGHKDIGEILMNAQRSFSDVGGGAISGDVLYLSVGYIIIIVYVCIVLGNFTCVDHRAWLSLGGVIVVGMSILVSFGLSSAFGAAYGPVHSILPFLLLGIGVDDMFVIIAAWKNLTPEEQEHPLPVRIGLMLKHAGVAVTVTSITDFVAFGIGATTILPALQSFCIFAALGVLGLFFFSVSFFVACHALNQKRSECDRNACCCCYTHKDYEPRPCGMREPMHAFFKKIYAEYLMKLPVKIIVMVVTFGVLGLNIYGVIHLEQHFEFSWFLPLDSYLYKYFNKMEEFFPGDGVSTNVYFGEIDYYRNASYLDSVYEEIQKNQYTYEGSEDSFYVGFKTFLNETDFNNLGNNSAAKAAVPYLNAAKTWPKDEDAFYALLRAYVLWVPSGLRYSSDINWTDTSPYRIKASRIKLKHKNLPNAQDEVRAMDSLRALARSTGLQETECFAYSRFYLNWEGNKVIQQELYRNIGLAFACVFIVTLVLIANLWTCLMVLTCVMFTLLDVGGLMYFWGLTIDTVTSVQTILAIGLAVDYAAHIGHMFMTELGTRDERAKVTIGDMGPAVFNGGFSTFLAFILLAGSNSYVFTTFFKVFFGVVVFGLFHGLVYLPVLLSWLGPAPYLTAEKQHEVDEEFIMKHPEKAHQKPDDAHIHGHIHAHHNLAMEKEAPPEPAPDYDDTPYIPPPDYTPPSTPGYKQRPHPSNGQSRQYSAHSGQPGRGSRPNSGFHIQNGHPQNGYIQNGHIPSRPGSHQTSAHRQSSSNYNNRLPNVNI